jgi:hypothetical protein
MVKRQYSVFLEEKLVKRASKLSKRYGSKLSPFLNEMLCEWCDREEAKWAQASQELT